MKPSRLGNPYAEILFIPGYQPQHGKLDGVIKLVGKDYIFPVPPGSQATRERDQRQVTGEIFLFDHFGKATERLESQQVYRIGKTVAVRNQVFGSP